jgi:hypothetical protein
MPPTQVSVDDCTDFTKIERFSQKIERPDIARIGRPVIIVATPNLVSSNHENGAKIIDVGSRRPRDDEVAD